MVAALPIWLGAAGVAGAVPSALRLTHHDGVGMLVTPVKCITRCRLQAGRKVCKQTCAGGKKSGGAAGGGQGSNSPPPPDAPPSSKKSVQQNMDTEADAYKRMEQNRKGGSTTEHCQMQGDRLICAPVP